jgi:hypothetical protein
MLAIEVLGRWALDSFEFYVCLSYWGVTIAPQIPLQTCRASGAGVSS